MYAKNKAVVEKYIKKFFYYPTNAQIKNIENKLIEIFDTSLKNVGLKLKKNEPIISIGSTTRNTYIEDDIDIDLSAKLNTSSAQLFKSDYSQYDFLLNEIKQNLHKNYFEYGKVTNFGLIKNETLYLFSFANLKHPNFKYIIKKFDLVLSLSNEVNIALINKKIIEEQLNKIKSDLNNSAKEDLLAQIRFTKYLFKQERININANGSIKYPKTTEQIGFKYGLVSVLTEKSLINLSLKDENGKYFEVGTFDSLMISIYKADCNYRQKNNNNMIPLELAICSPSITKIKQYETLTELAKARKEGTLPKHLENMNERIFASFKSESKWYLLVKMVRDYFESDEFEKNYLLSISSN